MAERNPKSRTGAPESILCGIYFRRRLLRSKPSGESYEMLCQDYLRRVTSDFSFSLVIRFAFLPPSCLPFGSSRSSCLPFFFFSFFLYFLCPVHVIVPAYFSCSLSLFLSLYLSLSLFSLSHFLSLSFAIFSLVESNDSMLRYAASWKKEIGRINERR